MDLILPIGQRSEGAHEAGVFEFISLTGNFQRRKTADAAADLQRAAGKGCKIDMPRRRSSLSACVLTRLDRPASGL
ncbi:MAG: hypothetical protein ACLPUO_05130 [Streptosporangiaceae bacterium]